MVFLSLAHYNNRKINKYVIDSSDFLKVYWWIYLWFVIRMNRTVEGSLLSGFKNKISIFHTLRQDNHIFNNTTDKYKTYAGKGLKDYEPKGTKVCSHIGLFGIHDLNADRYYETLS